MYYWHGLAEVPSDWGQRAGPLGGLMASSP